jgi:hypothetical protein
MPRTVFFSWQADRSKTEGRNLIDRALQRALARITEDTELEEAERDLEVDSDTKGVAGTPPIVDTIFSKIDRATAFVPDLTFVAKRPDGRPTPNPNVLIEYGWALKSLGHQHMVPVMNTAYGEPTTEAMPFDMRHLRYPITYSCPEGAPEDQRRAARDDLAKKLEGAIRAVLQSTPATSPETAQQFVRRAEEGGPGRFRAPGEPIGLGAQYSGKPKPINLVGSAPYWLRLWPKLETGRRWSLKELRAAADAPMIRPLNRKWGVLDHVSGADGFGVYAPAGDEGATYGLVYAFNNGEIWSIDTFRSSSKLQDGRPYIYLHEPDFIECLNEYSAVLKRLGAEEPFKWEAGVTGCKGWGIMPPSRSGYMSFGDRLRGQCMVEEIRVEGAHLSASSPASSLGPFFERVYEACGVERPAWLDEGQFD